MANKALISDLTWRSLEMQKAAFPDMPHYVGPKEIPHMLRPTSRQERDTIHVMSLAVIADNEIDFGEFIGLLRARDAFLASKEENLLVGRNKLRSLKLVEMWRSARRAGIQKIGGHISAAKREAESKEGCDRIRERWPLPSKTWPTAVLLKEADVSYNTAKKFLGRRPIEQANHEAKLKRKKLKEARANA